MIYVYAITGGVPPPQTLAGLAGFDDGPIAALESDGIAAVHSPVAAAPRPSRDALLHHERVVERLMADRPLLPARFGTLLRGEAALVHVLALNRDRLTAGLERVRGCVELGVRVLWAADPQVDDPAGESPPPSEGEGAGRAYMLARAARERQRQRTEARAAELAASLNRMFLPSARDGAVRVLPTPPFVLAGAYLVPRERATAFRATVDEAGAAFRSLRILCTGPWPPYHFVPQLSLPDAPVAEVSRG
jgi:hypothetical protein